MENCETCVNLRRMLNDERKEVVTLKKTKAALQETNKTHKALIKKMSAGQITALAAADFAARYVFDALSYRGKYKEDIIAKALKKFDAHKATTYKKRERISGEHAMGRSR